MAAAKNNKARGSNYEREVVNKLQPFYKKKLFTTRNLSTYLDSLGIDISTENPNDMNINYQAKTTATTPNYIKILNSLPTDKPRIMINKRTKKSDGGRFMCEGELVVMFYEDFEKLLEVYNKKI